MDVVIRNPARERLQAGELALGLGIRLGRTPEIAVLAKTCGYDYLFIDLEHNSLDTDATSAIAVAALGFAVAPIVRVPYGEYALASRALDCGALGVVMPHIATADEARELVEKLRVPPQGHRSATIYTVHTAFRSIPFPDLCEALNSSILLVAMVESPEAIDNVDEIAAVPGLDVVLVGANDLSLDLGIAGQYMHPTFVGSVTKVIDACRKSGKWAGVAGVSDQEAMREFISAGARFIYAGNDNTMLAAAAGQRSESLRSCLQ